MNKVWKEFGAFVRTLIEERRQKSVQAHDLFTVLLNMRDQESGEPLSDDEIAEELLGMIIGSHESVANSLTWLFFELGRNPSVHRELIRENKDVVRKAQITGESLSSLPLLKQAIYETLRLHPPFWFENRSATESVLLGGETLQKGALVVLSRYALHRNEKYWSEPEEFRLERFDERKISVDKLIRSGCYVPFSNGPRVCIGRHFAMLKMMTIATHLLQKFEVEIVEGQSAEVSTQLTMGLKDGLQVNLVPRFS